MPPRVRDIRDGMWAGQECWIVGGGPSLRGFDFSRMDGHLVIAVNRAHEFCRASVVLGMDRIFWAGIYEGPVRANLVFSDQQRDKLMNSPVAKLWVVSGNDEVHGGGDIQRVPRVGRNERMSSSLADGIVCGGNSGLAAINVACILGASKINLLGFDMRGADGKRAHFHDGYSNQQKDSVYQQFVNSIEKLGYPLAGFEDVEIVNWCADSAIDTYPKRDLADLPLRAAQGPVVVSFYTPLYREYAWQMEKSARLMGYETDVHEIPQEALGPWNHAAYHKAWFIRDMLLKHKRPVVWMDADTIMHRCTSLFHALGTCDLGVCHIDWRALGKPRDPELLNAVMYAAPTPACLRVMDRWVAECDAERDRADATGQPLRKFEQRILQEILESETGVNVGSIPMDHCQIFDLMASVSKHPAIECLQASRELKHLIQEGVPA